LSSGNVGIGTTSPNSRLEVVQSGNAIITVRQSLVAANGRFSQIVLSHGSTFFGASDKSYQLVSNGLSSGEADFAVQYWNGSTYAERMRITSGGNVLIGKTNDRLRLTVSGNDSNAPTLGTASGTAIFANNAGSTEYGMNFGVASTGYGWIQQHRFDGTSTVYALALQPSGGNVLIGTTTSVNHPLVVKSNSDANSICLVGRSSDDDSSIDFFSSNSSTFIATISADSLTMNIGSQIDIPLTFYTNTSEKMRITSGGNVLIGTQTNGASKLRIVGLPTSATGLSAGDVWNNSGTLRIV
jgi:hypothetical protein